MLTGRVQFGECKTPGLDLNRPRSIKHLTAWLLANHSNEDIWLPYKFIGGESNVWSYSDASIIRYSASVIVRLVEKYDATR